jgi:phosphoribosyl-ATP pyrophosphohydrolase
MVLLAFKDIDPSDILRELEKREGISGIEEKSKR